MKVLAIMPSLQDDNPGGIQVSGAIAWDALRVNTDAHLLEVASGDRIAAVRAAWKTRFPCDVALFWHLDLLQLAPFLKLTGRRAVFLHGIEAWRPLNYITRRLLRSSDILANSRYTLARAREQHPFLTTKSTIVPLGLGVPETRSTQPDAVPAAVMIGRLDETERYKGHHEVITAWPLVLREVPDAQLWIVGDGSLRGELEDLAHDLDLALSVRFYGRVSEHEKDQLLNASRCMVLPSRGEGFGLVYVEAMRLGRPCIAGVDAGVEVIAPPQAGRAIDPTDSSGLAAAIVLMLTGGAEWQRTSDAARQRYESNFTRKHFQDRLLRALEEIAH